MSVITRVLTKQLLSRSITHRQVTILPSVVKNEQNRNYSSSSKKSKSSTLISCGIFAGIVGYHAFKDEISWLSSSLPKVYAATVTSPRFQVSKLQILISSFF